MARSNLAESTGDPDADAVLGIGSNQTAPARTQFESTGDPDADAVLSKSQPENQPKVDDETLSKFRKLGYNGSPEDLAKDIAEHRPTDTNKPWYAYGPKYISGIWDAAKGVGSQIFNHPLKSAATAIPALAETVAQPIISTAASLPAMVNTADSGKSYAETKAQWSKDAGAEPETELGQKLSALGGAIFKPVGDVLSIPGKALSKGAEILGASPETQKATEEMTTDLAGFGLMARGEAMRKQSAETSPDIKQAQEALNKAYGGKSVGAASTAPDITKATPDMREAITNEIKKTGTVSNPKALERHLEADSLPVPVPLTEGMATGDIHALSFEKNNRAKLPAIANSINKADSALKENFTAIRDKVGPDVFSTNAIEHGDSLIDAYRAKDAVIQADVNAKYKALRDANGSTMPIDSGVLISNIDAQLKKQYLTDSVPPQAQSILKSLRSGEPMDFEGFEAARTRLAEAQRNGGSEAQAAKIIRNQLEQMPLPPEAAALKGLADSARSAARQRFSLLEADPAYEAAINGSVSPDKFVQKFIVNGPRDVVGKMRENLSDNPQALQTIGVSALDHLRESAGIDRQGNGNFRAATFNKNLEKMDPKLQSLFDPENAESITKLGRVSRYVTEQPAGSYVNNSNTFVAGAGEKAADLAEGLTNVAMKGVPVGSWIRKGAHARAEAQAVQRATEVGAGISRPTKLSELMATKQKAPPKE